jgi:diguanylate cyclase (GGDEF)-like protein
MTKLNQTYFKKYFQLLMFFLVLTGIGVGAFFYCVQQAVKRNTVEKISEDIERQSNHFRTILNIQYDYLEGLASYIGQSESLLSDQNLSLLSAIYDTENFDHVSIIEPDGTSHYDDGTLSDVSERRYFREAIFGSRTLSDPLESKIDGEVRVVLGVPVFEQGDADGSVIGILGGSYNVKALSAMLFNNFYDNAGCFLMVTEEGMIVFEDGMRSEDSIEDNNFFNYCGQINFRGGTTGLSIERDFEAQVGGLAEFDMDGEANYLIYEPLEINGWMICYCLPVSKGQEEYSFINHYEMRLTIYLVFIVMLLFLLAMIQTAKRQKEIMVYANTDALTGICNRKDTENRIEAWLQNPDCRGTQAFLMFDIDNFKQINDGHGHIVGDEVLSCVGDVMKEHFRDGDIVGRVGGDEFVVFMKNVSSCEDAMYRAGELARKLRLINVREFEDVIVTGSMGLAFSPENGITYDALYRCADRALYVTKENGRDGCTIYNSQLD